MPKRWEDFKRLKENGNIKSRIYMMFGDYALPQFQEKGLTQGCGNSQLRLGGVKTMLVETAKGVVPPLDELKRKVLEIHKAGFQLAIHAVEPIAVDAAASALDYAQSNFPQPDRRHRIEHCSDCPPELFEKLTRLNVNIVT